MRCYSCLPINKDLPNAMNAAEITDKLGLPPSGNFTGTYRAPVQQLGKVFMRGWIGFPTTLLTRHELMQSCSHGVILDAGLLYLVYFLFLSLPNCQIFPL